jgi:FkbH-like protein
MVDGAVAPTALSCIQATENKRGVMNLYQYSTDELLLKRRGLRRRLLENPGLREVRIAVLGGSTTNEVVDLLELLLLDQGFKPVFHQTEYGRYYTDAVISPEEIIDFKPELVYVHTTVRNIERFPSMQTSEEELATLVANELGRFQQIWNSLEEKVGCQIIQNNFELPLWAALGNLDPVHSGGQTRFVNELNLQFAREAGRRSKLILQDIQGIAARLGLNHWFDHDRWFSYKISQTVEGSMALAESLSSLVRAIYGRSRKVLVLDLDNTLWGGVIGDDGVDKLKIGKETPVAEAYTAFQEYCLMQRDRGVLLAVCSKNNEETAKQGFEHPDSVLKLEHFSAFKANWDPKHENITQIAQELNLGVDSFVFVDDNPAERAIVAAQVPGVAVPEVGDEVSKFIGILERERYFEPITLGQEDLERARLYTENSQRASLEKKFANYGEYLDSLEMVAEIDRFRPVYIERIAQLTNKTNQFNLTTRRYTLAEMESIMGDENLIGLYGRLADRFGDNGLVSVVLGRKEANHLHMDLWLMSCRVLKREMEFAMLDVLVEHARIARIEKIIGYYIPTKKNGMVAGHYEGLGFAFRGQEPSGAIVWELDVLNYAPRSLHIQRKTAGS